MTPKQESAILKWDKIVSKNRLEVASILRRVATMQRMDEIEKVVIQVLTKIKK